MTARTSSPTFAPTSSASIEPPLGNDPDLTAANSRMGSPSASVTVENEKEDVEVGDENEKNETRTIGRRSVSDSVNKEDDLGPPPPREPEIEYPEGGLRAWSVVLGSVLLACGTFGYANSWGIYQSYYSTTLLKHKSPSDIAWIGSIQYSLVLFPGIISGRLMDLGHLHVPLGIASVGQIVAVFLAAECKEYWQFLLCQGFLLGVCAGFAFGPCLAVSAHWFFKKRPLAFGVIATGSSMGGVIFPLAVKRLIVVVGFKWTMRITGFMLVFIFAAANLLVKKRLPPKNVKGGLFNFAIFKNVTFDLYGLGCFFGFLGVYTLLTYSDVAAEEGGIKDNLALSLVAIANGCSFFGRISSGYLATRYGPVNVLTPWTILAGVMTWIWPYVSDRAAPLIVIIVIYGISSGAFVGIIATPLSHPAFGGQGDLGRRIGMIFSISACSALVGTPISGAIRTQTGSYHAVGWYAGALTMISAFFLTLSRRSATGKFTAKF